MLKKFPSFMEPDDLLQWSDNSSQFNQVHTFHDQVQY
jgi:hypothetical protein